MVRYADSPDGARIACEVSGSGPPLVCVHGAGAGRFGFDLVRPLLEHSFAVIAIDRRGRGDSTDGPVYAVEREAEDVEAVLREAGEGAALFGHSYGALVAAAVLARASGAVHSDGGPGSTAAPARATGVDLVGAILYEPPAGGVLAEPGEIETWAAQIERGEADAFVTGFLAAVGGYTAPEIEAIRGTPAWRSRVAIAPTVPRELRAELAYRPDLEALASAGTPTLMLVGSESPAWAVESTPIYADALPNVTVHTLEGHGHGAALTGPDLLAREIRDFLG